MTDRKLQCEVITPEKILYQGEVDMAVVPGEDGELGILPLHAPLITTLRPGELRLKHGSNRQDYIAIDGGYMEVREDKVTVLAEAAEFASKMDLAELGRIKEQIEQELSSLSRDSEEFFAAAARLERIANRLEVCRRRTAGQ